MREWNSKLKGLEQKAADCLSTAGQGICGGTHGRNARGRGCSHAADSLVPFPSVRGLYTCGVLRLCLFSLPPLGAGLLGHSPSPAPGLFSPPRGPRAQRSTIPLREPGPPRAAMEARSSRRAGRLPALLPSSLPPSLPRRRVWEGRRGWKPGRGGQQAICMRDRLGMSWSGRLSAHTERGRRGRRRELPPPPPPGRGGELRAKFGAAGPRR